MADALRGLDVYSYLKGSMSGMFAARDKKFMLVRLL
jgi:hypothetical protein